MFPHRRMPCHITVLYVYSVINLVALFHATFVVAEIVVIPPYNSTIQPPPIMDSELPFTPSVPDEGISGSIIVASPPHACEPIQGPPPQMNSSRWFVLIERYPCPLEDKVRNAQAAGYDAAIIYSRPFSGVRPFDPESRDTDINIFGVMIREEDGKMIKNNFTYINGYMLVLYPSNKFNLLNYLVPFAIVIGVCCVGMFLCMIIKCIKDRKRNRRNRLSKKYLKQIPTKKFKTGDSYEVCAICLDEYVDGAKLRILPCSHAYHSKCIDPWLTNNRRTCPICKRKIVLEGMTSDSESESETENNDTSETTPLLRNTERQQNETTNGGTFSGGCYNSTLLNALLDHIPVSSSRVVTADLHHSFDDYGIAQPLLPGTSHSLNFDVNASSESDDNGSQERNHSSRKPLAVVCVVPPEDDACVGSNLHPTQVGIDVAGAAGMTAEDLTDDSVQSKKKDNKELIV